MKKLLFFLLLIPCLSFAQKTLKGTNKYYVKNYSEQQAIQYFNQSQDLDPIEGLWIGESGYKYSIEKDYDGSKRDPYKFRAILISIPGQTVADIGDISFFLRRGASNNLFESTYYLYRASWEGNNREYNIEPFSCVSILDGASLTSKIPVLDEDYGNITGEENSQYFKVYPQIKNQSTEGHNSIISSGTGFFATSDGYIITNHHVIEGAENGNIQISGINDDYNKSYKAIVVLEDKQNDLAILKIQDASSLPIINIPYTFKFSTSNIGEKCFVLGYPLISTMGRDIKLTTGIISSKTGYEGNVSQYQISAPIQPGNSGGPLFDKDGNIIGIIQAKHSQAENAGYAIKASYIKNLFDLLPQEVNYPSTNKLNGKDLPTQVRMASKTTCLIIINGPR